MYLEPEFVERPEIQRLFFSKRPIFFNNMSPFDLKARGMQLAGPVSVEMLSHYQLRYMQAYINAVQPFSPDEKMELLSLARQANILLRPFPSICGLPWRFCKLVDGIESGFPHTLEDVIFLPHDFFSKKEPSRSYEKNMHQKLKILVHEKVHVFQRKYPYATKILVHSVWNYSFFDYLRNHLDARNNPDLDCIMYKSNCNGSGFYMAYLPNAYPSLSNVRIRTAKGGNEDDMDVRERYEHPYERMAYEVSSVVVDQNLIDEYNAPLMRWMIDHL